MRNSHYFFILNLLFMMGWVVPSQAQSAVVNVPISGRFVYVDDRIKLISLNTATSEISILLQEQGYPTDVYFTPDGQSVLFKTLGDVYRYSFIDHIIQTTEIFDGYPGLFDLQGFSPDETTFYYIYLDFTQTSSPPETFLLSKPPQAPPTTLLTFPNQGLVETLPLPSTLTQYRFDQFNPIQPNPVYSEWILVRTVGSDPADVLVFDTSTQEQKVYLSYLWNMVTDEWILLEPQVGEDGKENILLGSEWSPDGQSLALLYSADNFTERLYIVDFDPATGQVEIVESAFADAAPQSWLGVDDLLLTTHTNINYSNPDTSFYVGKIINDTWYEREFFRLESTNGKPFDWYLTANETERHELSCLFDLALPQQLSQGIQATNLLAQSLRAEPDPEAATITTLNVGDTVTITGHRACTDNVRWWQVTTASGAVGWAMEANNTQYYLLP